MTRHYRALLAATALTLSACSGARSTPETAPPAPPGAPSTQAPVAPDSDPFQGTAPPEEREPPPPPGMTPDWSFPTIQTEELPSGLTVRVVERNTLPLVDIRLVVLSGTASDGEHPGLGVLAGELLKAGGAGKWDSRALVDHAESLGSSVDVITDRDATTISMSVTRDQFEEALDVIAAIATKPRFDYREFTKLKQREVDRVQSLARSDAGWAASMVLYRELFDLPTAEHPYARYDATSEQLEKLNLQQCRTWHRTHFTPKNAVLVVTGDVTSDDAKAKADKALGKWRGAPPPKPSFQKALPPGDLEIYLVDRPDSPQAEIFLATLGPKRQSPEWPKLRVANQILGGGVAGRLFLDVREKRSLAYRTRSSLVSVANGPVPIVLTAGTQTAKAGLALEALLEHFETMGREPPSQDEVDIATRYLSDIFLLSVDTVEAVGSMVEALSVNNLPDDYYDTYRKAVRDVEGADVLELAKKHFEGRKALAVVAGDAKRLSGPLSHFAPVVVVDPEKGFSTKKEVKHDPSAPIELERRDGT